MAASRRTSLRALVSACALAISLPFCLVQSAASDETSPEEAIAKARALEEQGFHAEAEVYLAGLVGEDGPLARDASVLLEAARLARDVEACRELADRAIERTRSSSIIFSARLLRGDSYFAEGLYLAAAREYEIAGEHSPGRGPGEAELKRARSLLAAGDARAATRAYREIAEAGSVPTEITPLAELGLARSLLMSGNAADAAEQFETTARVHDDHYLRPRALAGAAESHEAAGNHAAALEALERIVTEYPGSFEAVLARERLTTYTIPDTVAPAEPDTLENE